VLIPASKKPVTGESARYAARLDRINPSDAFSLLTAHLANLQKGVTFSLVRITGMKRPDDWHNTGVTITLDDNDHMTQRWTYLPKRKPGITIFHYTRKKSLQLFAPHGCCRHSIGLDPAWISMVGCFYDHLIPQWRSAFPACQRELNVIVCEASAEITGRVQSELVAI
jgi:hypothetical protein